MAEDVRIPGEVAAVLRFCVYALRDPRDGRVFCVGKGIGDRINSHSREAGNDPESERAKLRTITEIESVGHRVDLLFLRTGIDDERTAFIVAQAVIDAFAADGHPLTNLVRGHNAGTEGLATLPAIVARLRAQVRDVVGGRAMYRRYLDGYPGAPEAQTPILREAFGGQHSGSS